LAARLEASDLFPTRAWLGEPGLHGQLALAHHEADRIVLCDAVEVPDGPALPGIDLPQQPEDRLCGGEVVPVHRDLPLAKVVQLADGRRTVVRGGARQVEASQQLVQRFLSALSDLDVVIEAGDRRAVASLHDVVDVPLEVQLEALAGAPRRGGRRRRGWCRGRRILGEGYTGDEGHNDGRPDRREKGAQSRPRRRASHPVRV
jgi:hypothetical protein